MNNEKKNRYNFYKIYIFSLMFIEKKLDLSLSVLTFNVRDDWREEEIVVERGEGEG